MATYKMPGHPVPAAAAEELRNALGAARCSIEVAGMETEDFVVRELLLAALRAIDRAAESAERLRPA